MKSFQTLAEVLPPVLARAEVHERLGGVISPKTLANLDSKGEGPSGRFKLGGRVCYDTASLLSWLDERKNGIQGGS